jgi:hypothetical protein
VLSQASSTKMKLVNFALNYRGFGSAQVTAAANPLVGGRRLLPGRPRGDLHLHHSRFDVEAGGDDESTQ